MRRVVAVGLIGIVLLGVLAAAFVVAMNLRGEDGPSPELAASQNTSPIGIDAATQIRRGEYLMRAGDCVACHSSSGGPAFAGGRALETPFGNIYAPNLTPDAKTGLGGWSKADFWRALHNGRSRGGRLLYPAFPYPNYTRVQRADSDAMFAYLKSLPPAAQPNRPNDLRFPFNLQASLAVWRALYFRPAAFTPDAERSAEWNRGAYLVEGLGHCNACHSRRNALGASSGPLDLAGGLIPVQNWYAPSLTSSAEAGVADWTLAEIAELLKRGVSARGAVTGPMVEVVADSTQYLSDADLLAMATYLKSLPPSDPPAAAGASTRGGAAQPSERGAQLYAEHCEACHRASGEGVAKAYPALRQNRAVTLNPPANLVHIVLQGGFPPATAGNPRPYGMPPFATVLGNDEVAELLSYVRGAWGNRAAPVSALEVSRYRGGAGG